MSDWRKDKDEWLFRKTRKGDEEAIASATSHCFISADGCTYCRSFGQAEAIDAGVRMTSSQADKLANDRHATEA